MIPEGMHLTTKDDGTLTIADAQDVVWVTFPRAEEVTNREDPIDWLIRVVKRTCAALDVTEYFTVEGEQADTLVRAVMATVEEDS